mmetsp:Transcript_73923/g.239247  ORF Transcript_73923/g.239247 Transcript_73923/m.239247 type:complete len:213 (+) Transcript_73923:356-994(+)
MGAPPSGSLRGSPCRTSRTRSAPTARPLALLAPATTTLEPRRCACDCRGRAPSLLQSRRAAPPPRSALARLSSTALRWSWMTWDARQAQSGASLQSSPLAWVCMSPPMLGCSKLAAAIAPHLTRRWRCGLGLGFCCRRTGAGLGTSRASGHGSLLRRAPSRLSREGPQSRSPRAMRFFCRATCSSVLRALGTCPRCTWTLASSSSASLGPPW